jgi:hypothetical protein
MPMPRPIGIKPEPAGDPVTEVRLTGRGPPLSTPTLPDSRNSDRAFYTGIPRPAFYEGFARPAFYDPFTALDLC